MARTAGIILIGNEILSGKVVDANAVYLCREFRALGVDVPTEPAPRRIQAAWSRSPGTRRCDPRGKAGSATPGSAS